VEERTGATDMAHVGHASGSRTKQFFRDGREVVAKDVRTRKQAWHLTRWDRVDVCRTGRRKTTWTSQGLGSGGGVLDRPAPVLPGKDVDQEVEKRRQKKKPPLYRVMLHNDNVNRREYVVQVLMKTVPGMTVDTAVNIMQEAHVNGIACVITTSQQEAEDICEAMRGNGLIASIEPAGKGS